MFRKILILIAFFLYGSVIGSRVRRHLVFSENSRLFFSVNIRDNLFSYSDFFAQVFGFKIDWDLPSKIIDSTNNGRIQRRDLYQGIESLLHRQNLNGSSCIRKFLCEASIILPKCNHFLAQFYEVIFSTDYKFKTNVSTFDDSVEDCRAVLNGTIVNECPLSLLSVFPGNESDFSILIN